jgi:hypothetical protein
MVRKVFTLLFGSALVVALSIPVFTQEGSSDEGTKQPASQQTSNTHKAAKQDRWEGIVMRTNPQKHTLVVRRGKSNAQKTVYYDASTQIVSQEHGSKQVTPIDPGQISDNDRVICLGNLDDKGDLHATLISKRLSNPLSH